MIFFLFVCCCCFVFALYDVRLSIKLKHNDLQQLRVIVIGHLRFALNLITKARLTAKLVLFAYE